MTKTSKCYAWVESRESKTTTREREWEREVDVAVAAGVAIIQQSVCRCMHVHLSIRGEKEWRRKVDRDVDGSVVSREGNQEKEPTGGIREEVDGKDVQNVFRYFIQCINSNSRRVSNQQKCSR